jgi:FKBP-type peptidyl-prolyl cis-trans isomerase (trigger factor)
MKDKKNLLDTPPNEMAKKRAENEEKQRDQYREKIKKLANKPFEKLSRAELSEVLSFEITNLRNNVAIQQSKFGRDVERCKEATTGSSKVIKSLLTFQGELESKIDTALDIIKDHFDVTDREFEDRWDDRRGLIRLDSGAIMKQDVVIINFKAHIQGTPEAAFSGNQAENWPIRVGSGAFYGEEQLIGKPRAEGSQFSIDVEFEKDNKNEEIAGKIVTFDIEVVKVKVTTAILESRSQGDKNEQGQEGSGSKLAEASGDGQSTEV